MSADNDKCVLVVGGGISRHQRRPRGCRGRPARALVERSPSLGGRVAGMHRYFPKLCPPYCGLEINYRRIKANPRVEVLTNAEVTRVDGSPGDLRVTVQIRPRMVNDRCTACSDCVALCPVERPNAHNYGLDKTKAIYLPHQLAFPMRYVVDTDACPGESCGKCLPACKFDAIDSAMKGKELELRARASSWEDGSPTTGLGSEPWIWQA